MWEKVWGKVWVDQNNFWSEGKITMKKSFMSICTLGLPFILAGCSKAGSEGASAATVYGAAALLSFFLLIGYCLIERKRDKWFLLLFSSVLVVNIGYFALSVSHGLAGALMANRVSYLGSVFLPLSMLMIILDTTGLRYKRQLPVILLSLAAMVFLIAASPGYLDIYYKEVSFVTIDGVSMLQKIYGPWHFLYGLYLLCYFSAMVAAIIHASVKQMLESTGHAVILAIAVFVNIGVWFVEQLADFNFEFLSISYIISELFLLGLHLMVAEHQRLKNLVTEKEQALTETAQALNETEKALSEAAAEVSALSSAVKSELPGAENTTVDHVKIKQFIDGVPDLTETEKSIFDAYIVRTPTKEIMATLNIKENTLKFHNKNIYHKLGVSSRKELIEIHKQVMAEMEQHGEVADVTV